ncbi:hypothetical protein Y032_0072g655 [Ancylostoma ceylanicum]|nr:hypothetical protein Y032_0072g655 [Ancylostoma ceylanicum]
MVKFVLTRTPTPPTPLLSQVQRNSSSPVSKVAFSGRCLLVSVSPMTSNLIFLACTIRSSMEASDASVHALKISSDWSYVANVIDRLVLIIFTFVNLVGTTLIIQNSPMLFDSTEPMKIGSASRPLSGDTFESAFDANFTQESWWKNSGGL